MIQAVSESLNTLVDAHGDTSSPQHNTTDDAVTSSSAAPSERHPLGSEAAESKAAAAAAEADDVMVQIRARKSEVGVSVSRSVSCSGSDISRALFTLCQANE